MLIYVLQAPMVDKQVAIQIRDKHGKRMVKELQPLKMVSPYVSGGMMGELESEVTILYSIWCYQFYQPCMQN